MDTEMYRTHPIKLSFHCLLIFCNKKRYFAKIVAVTNGWKMKSTKKSNSLPKSSTKKLYNGYIKRRK